MQKLKSDESMQNATTSAMRGLMDLAAQRRASAIQNGYKAYGQYRTSEDLDVLRSKSRTRFYEQAANTINVTHAPLPKVYKVEPVYSMKTSFARLDPKFLREGEAGKVADEFEKQTGMKRENLLKIMAKASESTISPSDPKMVDKVISRFEAFLKEIPNEEFRKNVQKTIDEVPETMRTGMIAKGVQKIAEIMAKMPKDKSDIAVAKATPVEIERKPAASVAVVAEIPPAAATSPSPPSPAVPGESEADAAARQAADSASAKMLPTESGYKGLDKENFARTDMIGSVMQTALEEQKEETIFKQVSKRYRAMTPRLSLAADPHP